MCVRYSHYFSAFVAVLTLSFILVCGGCAGSESAQPPHPYSAEFEQAIADDASDFVRSVLVDGVITPAEYRESRDGFRSCLEAAGIEPLVTNADNGTIQINIPSAAANDPHYLACEKQWDGGLGLLYESILTNPSNTPWFDLVAACLVHEGFATAGLTGDDVDKLYQKAATVRYESSEGDLDGGREVPIVPEDPDPVLPGGRKLFDEEHSECLRSPGEVLAKSSATPS